jgi:hypothetical protein
MVEQEGLRNFALGSVIGTRCSRYLPREGRAPCKSAVKKMIQILDYDILITNNKAPNPNQSWNPRSFVFVAFKSNLISLLSTTQTADYLSDLNQKLYQYLIGNLTEANVWDITRSHFKTDFLTSQAMATLFQDTSRMKLHLAYLERAGTRGNLNFQSNKEMLGRVIDTINLILDSSEDEFRELFYPKEIQKDLNRNIYHFYVPLYLAKALEQQGVTKRYAFSSALMLTLSYEFITSSPDYRFLFRDPETITNLYKVKDIFGGYCGANIGVRGMNFFKSFEVIRSSFERSTQDAVELLLRH